MRYAIRDAWRKKLPSAMKEEKVAARNNNDRNTCTQNMYMFAYTAPKDADIRENRSRAGPYCSNELEGAHHMQPFF
jgi:hypothetical protein